MTETVRLPSGEIVEVSPGWNDLGARGRVYLRRDGSVVFDSPPIQASLQVEDGSAEVTPATPSLGTPYRAWSRPPFTVGHTLSTKHGGYSPRRVEPLVEELVTSTLTAAPFLDSPSFRASLEAWARAEARCALLARFLDDHGLLDDAGVPRPATKLMTSQESLALKLRARLGLDAASRAGIEASLTSTAASQASLEAVLARGAEQLRQRAAEPVDEGATS